MSGEKKYVHRRSVAEKMVEDGALGRLASGESIPSVCRDFGTFPSHLASILAHPLREGLKRRFGDAIERGERAITQGDHRIPNLFTPMMDQEVIPISPPLIHPANDRRLEQFRQITGWSREFIVNGVLSSCAAKWCDEEMSRRLTEIDNLDLEDGCERCGHADCSGECKG